MKTKNLVRVGLMVLSLVLALVLIEVILRFTPYGEIKKGTILVKKSEDPIIAYELKANFTRKFQNPDGEEITYRTNPQGYRGQKYSSDNGANILFLGDSITFGFGVSNEQSFVQLTRNYLSERQVGSVEVVNLGVSGYNTEQEVALYKKRQSEFSPKYVILGYALNDASPEGDWLWDDSQDRIMLKQPVKSEDDYKGPLGGKFPFGRLLDQSRIYRLTLRPLLFPEKQLTKSSPSDKGEYDLYVSEYFGDRSVEAWEKRKGQILYLRNLVQDNGQKLIIVILPLAYQVEFETDQNPQQKITDFANENGIDYIDILPIFKAKGLKVNDLFIDNSHPSSIGHQVIAEEISKFISIDLTK